MIYNKINAMGKGDQLEAFIAEYEWQDYERIVFRGGAGFQINKEIDVKAVSEKYPDLTIYYEYEIVHKEIEGWSEWVNGKMVEKHEEKVVFDEESEQFIQEGDDADFD